MSDDDIYHALTHYVRVYAAQGDQEVALFIGPAVNGLMLEVGVVEQDEPLVIHAMPARAKYWP